MVVTAPGAAASTNYNPGGIIPEAAPQWSSWLLFLGLLGLLVLLFFAPMGLRFASEHTSFNLPTFAKPKAKSRIKLTDANPGSAATPPQQTATRPSRIRIVKKSSDQTDAAHTTLPWDEGEQSH